MILVLKAELSGSNDVPPKCPKESRETIVLHLDSNGLALLHGQIDQLLKDASHRDVVPF